MDLKTSGILFGSAITDDWSKARSDIDLVITLPSMDYYQKFSNNLKALKEILPREIIDGVVTIESEDLPTGLLATDKTEFIKFTDQLLPTDQWKIKHESKLIFGNFNLKNKISDVDVVTLKQWAHNNKGVYWEPVIKKNIERLSNTDKEISTELTSAIWMVSGVGRIVTLSQSGKLSSKQQSLLWVKNNIQTDKELIDLLIENYEVSDKNAIKLTKRQMLSLSNRSLDILKLMNT